MRIKFIKKEEIAKNIVSFYFDAPTKLRFLPGQYVDMHLPHEGHDERGHTRTLTISSTPSEAPLAFTTKIDPSQKLSTFKQQLLSLSPGSEVTITNPMGDFVLPKDVTIPLIFIAGGIGSAPFRSILKSVEETGEKRDITLYYAVKNSLEIAFTDEFNKLGDKFHLLISERLDLSKITQENPKDCLYFLSGPKTMIMSYHDQLVSQGVPKNKLVLDYFPGYTDL